MTEKKGENPIPAQKRTASANIPARLFEIAVIAGIAAFAFYVNRGIVIKGLYMDDLYMWSCYGEQSIWEFAFPIGTSTRFRPVYWLATYLQMAVIGTHVDRFVAFNIIINLLAALLIYFMAKKLSGGRLSAVIAGGVSAAAYLASRFAYYQIGQALGLMETMALMMALFILYMLLGFIRDESSGRFYAALIMYFLIVFTHERYLCLFPLFYAALILKIIEDRRRKAQGKNGPDKLMWTAPVITLIAVTAIRTFAIGKAMPAGTGGTEVTDTFSISQAIEFCFDQVLYIFGVNAGPEYLNGVEWSAAPWYIKRLVKYSVLFIGLLMIMFALSLIKEAVFIIKNKENALDPERRLWDNVSVSIMFILFTALCIACSSVTIRLEMRWIYVSYAAALLFASFMTGAVMREIISLCREGGLRRLLLTVPAALFIAYGVLSAGANMLYREYFPNIYFWADQERMNSLAEETVEKYGTEGIFGKNIYIIGNTYGMSRFYADTFFKTYDRDKKAEGTNVIFAESISDVPAEEIRKGSAIALIEVPEENKYRDITSDLK